MLLELLPVELQKEGASLHTMRSSQVGPQSWGDRVGRFKFREGMVTAAALWGPRAPQVELVAKNLPARAADTRGAGSIPGLGKSALRRKCNPLQCPCLENPHGQRSLAGCSPWGRRVGHDRVT